MHEVSLLGTADMAFWQKRLQGEDLAPAADEHGHAQLLIVAADMRFMGVRFCELSFSVLVEPELHVGQQAAYLVGAFNSRRFFAWYERRVFATPYQHADVRVSATLPATIDVAAAGVPLFEARMQAGAGRAPTRSGEAAWEGPIFLPERQGGGRKMFFARLRGHTQAYPFLPPHDTLAITPGPGGEALQALLDSGFAASEWVIRADARHAKSNTYPRSAAQPAAAAQERA